MFTNVTTNAYQDQLNAGFSKVCEIFKVRSIETLKYVRELLWWHFNYPKRDAEWNELWLVVWHVGQTASWAGLGQWKLPWIPDLQPSVWLRETNDSMTRHWMILFLNESVFWTNQFKWMIQRPTHKATHLIRSWINQYSEWISSNIFFFQNTFQNTSLVCVCVLVEEILQPLFLQLQFYTNRWRQMSQSVTNSSDWISDSLIKSEWISVEESLELVIDWLICRHLLV